MLRRGLCFGGFAPRHHRPARMSPYAADQTTATFTRLLTSSYRPPRWIKITVTISVGSITIRFESSRETSTASTGPHAASAASWSRVRRAAMRKPRAASRACQLLANPCPPSPARWPRHSSCNAAARLWPTMSTARPVNCSHVLAARRARNLRMRFSARLATGGSCVLGEVASAFVTSGNISSSLASPISEVIGSVACACGLDGPRHTLLTSPVGGAGVEYQEKPVGGGLPVVEAQR